MSGEASVVWFHVALSRAIKRHPMQVINERTEHVEGGG